MLKAVGNVVGNKNPRMAALLFPLRHWQHCLWNAQVLLQRFCEPDITSSAHLRSLSGEQLVPQPQSYSINHTYCMSHSVIKNIPHIKYYIYTLKSYIYWHSISDVNVIYVEKLGELILFRKLYMLYTSCRVWRKFSVVNSCVSGKHVTFQWHLWGEVICSVFTPSVGHDYTPITSSVGGILLFGYDAKVEQVSWRTCMSMGEHTHDMEPKHSGMLDQIWKNIKILIQIAC